MLEKLKEMREIRIEEAKSKPKRSPIECIIQLGKQCNCLCIMKENKADLKLALM